MLRRATHGKRALLRWPRGVAQPGSAPGLGPGGRRFESSRPDHCFQTLKIHFWFFHHTAVDDFVDGESLTDFPSANLTGISCGELGGSPMSSTAVLQRRFARLLSFTNDRRNRRQTPAISWPSSAFSTYFVFGEILCRLFPTTKVFGVSWVFLNQRLRRFDLSSRQ